MAEGDARFLAQTLASYGYQPDQLGPDLRRRLLALGILHRYGNLSWSMQRLPEPACPTLDALADRWSCATVSAAKLALKALPQRPVPP